jgi:hypothetical protein
VAPRVEPACDRNNFVLNTKRFTGRERSCIGHNHPNMDCAAKPSGSGKRKLETCEIVQDLLEPVGTVMSDDSYFLDC